MKPAQNKCWHCTLLQTTDTFARYCVADTLKLYNSTMLQSTCGQVQKGKPRGFGQEMITFWLKIPAFGGTVPAGNTSLLGKKTTTFHAAVTPGNTTTGC